MIFSIFHWTGSIRESVIALLPAARFHPFGLVVSSGLLLIAALICLLLPPSSG